MCRKGRVRQFPYFSCDKLFALACRGKVHNGLFCDWHVWARDSRSSAVDPMLPAMYIGNRWLNFYLPLASDLEDITFEEMSTGENQDRSSLASYSSGTTTDSDKVCLILEYPGYQRALLLLSLYLIAIKYFTRIFTSIILCGGPDRLLPVHGQPQL